ncbi:putative RDD family membrane protein YckC [Silvimonas terrae]|uniref:Putative RDD family membrane protein YckC n=1 Tax=Silvimonas terrae TaxID=300266 RepID=A0A840RL41_9NEIS|nr:RDD family protein [Silvimonas terrae]MBB5192913.1 putative RDD family membrane protein YckC [Silvimonas terrae]
MDLHNPYQAPGASLDIPTAGHATDLAPRSKRLYAALVDRLLVIGGAVIGLTTGTSIALSKGEFNLPNFLPFLLSLSVGLINLVLLSRSGQTIGKWLFRIKIVRQSGERCGLRRYLFLRALPLGILVAIFNYALSHRYNSYPAVSVTAVLSFPQLSKCAADILDASFIFRASRKCLHDNIADTKVVLA